MDDTDGDDDADDTDDNDGDDSEDDIRDPKAKVAALNDQLTRLHKKIRKQYQVIAQLRQEVEGSDNTEALRSVRLETAFLRTTMQRQGDDAISDLETAWDLL